MMESTKQEYQLDPDSELRFEIVSRNKKVTLELKTGLAEIFGTELVTQKKYTFRTGSNLAVFTWQGCTVELEGTPDVIYIVKETPMLIYLNCHAILQRLRELAEKQDEKGPVTMIVGPYNMGKKTISRLLANYALRMNSGLIYVNVDVAQVEFAVPGTFGALLLNKPANIEEGFSQEAPVVFHFGYDSPQCNETLYKFMITRLAEVCNDHMKINQEVKHSGIIINTSGWIKGEGYKALTHIAQVFEVDAIFVIDQEKLYSDLLGDMPDFVKVVLLPKSGGVVEKSQAQRTEARSLSIHNYFYGFPKLSLHPYKIKLNFDDVVIYRIKTCLASSSKPVDLKSDNNVTRLEPLQPFPNMKNHLLSISFADSDQDDIVQSNVAGFLHMVEINMQKKILTVLSPQPQLMPNLILLYSEIKYWDNS